MARKVKSSDPDEIFKMHSLEAFNGNGEKVKLRFYIPNEQNIINSGLLYSVLKSHYPEMDSHKELIQTFIQAHRFNVGEFGGKKRSDNLPQKNKVKLNPDTLKPSNLRKLRVESDYFGGEVFSEENIEKLFNIFKPNLGEKILIDDILFQKLPSFYISRKGYTNYLMKVFNSVYNCWLEKSLMSFDDLKKRLIEEDIIEENEKIIYYSIKTKFLKLFNIKDSIFTINESQILNTQKDELNKIISEIKVQLNKSLIGTREGKRKRFLTVLQVRFKEIEKIAYNEKVEILTEFFDQIIERKVIYIHLSRRLEKFYEIIIGRFCKVILPLIVKQWELSREEIRLFILMNIPLRTFNYHRTTENLIQQFVFYHNYLDRLLLLMVFRKRSRQELNDFEILFKSYLKTYHGVVNLIREYEREKKRSQRSREDKMLVGTDIDSIEYENVFDNVPIKSKKNLEEDPIEYNELESEEEEVYPVNDFESNEDPVDENSIDYNELGSEEEEVYPDDDYESNEDPDEEAATIERISRNDAIDNEDNENEDDILSVKKSAKKVAKPKREYSVRNVELDDFLSYYKFDKIDRDIIYFKMEKCSFNQIAELLTPTMSKQAVSKRWTNIMAILPYERELYQRIMDR